MAPRGDVSPPQDEDTVSMKELQELLGTLPSQLKEQQYHEQIKQQLPPQPIVPLAVDVPSVPRSSSWKAEVAHQSRNAVVKILPQVVEFDWEHPYKRAEMGEAVGSGFFVSNDGIFVTNAHVVEDAAKVWITVPSEGERRYNAEVLGICFDVDLAILQSKDAPVSKYLEFGDSNQVQYGQEVLTLGYPLGMESLKLTEGIISGREESLFQTDAPLNPGNSGGPMLNAEGKVIGVNVAIVEQSQNVGFAIPSFHLTQLFDTMKNRPKDKRVVHKPILGADWSNTTEAMHRYMGCSHSTPDTSTGGKIINTYTGIYIRKCYEGFPLYNAGVRDGDILHSFHGYQLDNFGNAIVPWSPYARASLDSLMSLCTHDSKPEIEYSSKGKYSKTNVSFEDPKNKGVPILPIIREYHPPYEKIDFEIIAGMVVMDLTLNHISLFHEHVSDTILKLLTPIAASFEERLKPSLVISDILVGSLLNRANVFSAGTLLDEVNGIKVSSLQEFREAMLKPVTKGKTLYITLTSKTNELVVLPLRDVFREEFELSEMHMYNISPLIVASLASNKDMLGYLTKGNRKVTKRFAELQHKQQQIQKLMTSSGSEEDNEDDEDLEQSSEDEKDEQQNEKEMFSNQDQKTEQMAPTRA